MGCWIIQTTDERFSHFIWNSYLCPFFSSSVIPYSNIYKDIGYALNLLHRWWKIQFLTRGHRFFILMPSPSLDLSVPYVPFYRWFCSKHIVKMQTGCLAAFCNKFISSLTTETFPNWPWFRDMSPVNYLGLCLVVPIPVAILTLNHATKDHLMAYILAM